MNIKAYAIAAVAVFVAIFLFEGAWHGVAFRFQYEATADMWRSEEDSVMAAITVGQAIYAAAIALLFAGHGTGSSTKHGLVWGAVVGVVAGSVQLASYCYTPFPDLGIPVQWFFSEVIKGALAGFVLSKAYRP